MNQEELLIAAIAIITVVFSCAIIWLQNKLDTARDHISPVLERRKQDEQLTGTLRRTIDTTRKQLEDEKQFSIKLISEHTKETAEADCHAIELQEKNASLMMEIKQALGLRLEQIGEAEEAIDELRTEIEQATDIIDKTKKLLQRGAKGQDTLAALVLIEEYQKNK